ncbi:HMG domain-containing protein 3 [Stigmatopora nigra]
MEPFEAVKLTEEVESTNKLQVQVLSSKKRKRKSQEEEGEGRAKKPRSAYLLYYFDVHQTMQHERPNQPQSEINKRISESWKRLSVAEKGYYLEKAHSEKEGSDRLSLLNTSKDLPGFRKILPRASRSYLVLADDLQAGSSLAECLNPPSDGNASFPEAGKVRVPLLNNNYEKDTGEVWSAITSPCGSPASKEASVWRSSADPSTNVFSMKECDVGKAVNVSSGVSIEQSQREATHTVAIIPNQNQLEAKALAAVSTLGPLMMVPVAAKEKQSTEAPYKMAVKTYTRRGRGRCVNPRCSFVYVTRHKPIKCPQCGSHLGGKWIPAEKKSPKKDGPVSTSGCQKTTQKERQGKAGASKKQTVSKEIHTRKQAQPAEGIIQTPSKMCVSLQPQIRHVKQIASQKMCNLQGRPVRPILPSYCNRDSGLFQVLAVPTPNRKTPTQNNKALGEQSERFSGLKESTLKQLEQSKQDSPVTSVTSQSISTLSSQPPGMAIVSVVPFKHVNVDSFDLGLSTARGRGHCKNKLCDYMYKNRHKPPVCPKCGCELTQGKKAKSVQMVDPCQPLSPSQKDLQRQSTLQLIRHSLQIPEGEAELQESLALIRDLNSLQIVLVQEGGEGGEDKQEDAAVQSKTLVESGWPQLYESSATQCVLCGKPLYKGDQSTIAGQEECWLLTEMLIQTASLQLKVCLNARCLALHSFTDLHPGLFNIGNRLLVSIDLFLKIRGQIGLGQQPTRAVRTLFDHISTHPVHALSPEESSQIEDFLLVGYWAFESLTLRDYNDMICGICGVAPVLEVSRRYVHNVLELKNLEFTWPETSVSDEVNPDDFWLTMETEAIEQAAFPAEIPITRVDASIIAPFIPPLMRSPTVINTEKDKLTSQARLPAEAPSILVRLIHDGELRPDEMEHLGEEQLRSILERCGVSVAAATGKNDLVSSLVSMCTHVQSGLPTGPPPPGHLTAGKLCKVCPHQVVCGSKCLVRGETARDHVDLLLSSRFWPPVYVGDCARQVALCTDMQYPGTAAGMWGRNQGCFSEPFQKPETVSCPELGETARADEPSAIEDDGGGAAHPRTGSTWRRLAHPPAPPGNREAAPPDHHSMALCKELEHLVGAVTQISHGGSDGGESPWARLRTQRVMSDNPAHYYLYNRLLDFLSSRDIVNEQIERALKACRPGEVVVRDALYRLGVANVANLAQEAELKSGAEEVTGGAEEVTGGAEEVTGGAEMAYQVVLPE